MKQKVGRITIYSFLVICLVIGSFLVGQIFHSFSTASANSNVVNGTGEESTAGIVCTIDQINVFSSRIHVHCTAAAPGGISFFVYSTAGTYAPTADRILMLANTAFSLNKHLGIGYDTVSSHNLSGCYAADCRNIIWVSLRP